MASNFYYPTSKNAVQKTLAAQLLNSAGNGDAITFADVDGVQNKPGVLVINRVDSNGTATPSSREYISYSGTSGNTVLIETRNVDSSASAKTHAVGSIVEFIPDAVWAQRLIEQILIEHGVDGTHDSTKVVKMTGDQTVAGVKTFTSPVINTGISGTAIVDEDDMASNSATKVPTQQSVKAYVDANAGAGGKYVFIIPGTAATGTDVAGTWFAPEALTIDTIDLYADAAGDTGSTIVDVNIDGTTAFTTQGNRPTLATTATADTGNVPDVTSVTANQKITVDVDQICTTPQVDLYVVIKYS